MTHEQLEVLSNQAVAACAFAYFLAFLAHLGQWAAGRQAAPAASGAASGGNAVAARSTAVATLTAERADVRADAGADEPERMLLLGRIGVALTVVAAVVHLLAVVTRGLAADPVRVPWGNMYEFTLTGTFFVTLGYLLLYKRFGLSLALPGRHRLRAGGADGRRAGALRAGRAAAGLAAVAVAGDPRRGRGHRDRRVHHRRDVLGRSTWSSRAGSSAPTPRTGPAAATSPGCPSSPCSTGWPTAPTRSASRSGPSRP